jgi:hypothetical protein
MVAIQSLRDALGALRRDPVLFVGGLALAAVVLPQNALSQFGIPIVPQLLQLLTFFVTPFVLAGIVGMASEALSGSTRLGTLTEQGKTHYVQLLLAKLLEFGIYVLFAVVFFLFAFVLVIVGIFALGISTAAASGNPAGAIGIVGIVLAVVLLGIPLLLYIAVRVLIQFFLAAIVVDGVDAVEGYKRSVAAVREHTLSAVGVWLLNLVITFLIGSPLTLFVLYRSAQRFDAIRRVSTDAAPGATAGMDALFSTPETALIVAATFLLTAVTTPFSLTYETAFYRRVTDDEDEAAPDSPDDSAIGTTDTGTDDGSGAAAAGTTGAATTAESIDGSGDVTVDDSGDGSADRTADADDEATDPTADDDGTENQAETNDTGAFDFGAEPLEDTAEDDGSERT